MEIIETLNAGNGYSLNTDFIYYSDLNEFRVNEKEGSWIMKFKGDNEVPELVISYFVNTRIMPTNMILATLRIGKGIRFETESREVKSVIYALIELLKTSDIYSQKVEGIVDKVKAEIEEAEIRNKWVIKKIDMVNKHLC